MTRRAIRIGSGAVLAFGVTSALLLGQNQRPPTFRAGAVLVTVDAYPQRDGRTVEGLTAADFEILEDGKPQKIENFEFVRIEPSLSESERRDPNTQRESLDQAADPHNRVFVVYLDTLHVTVSGSHDIRRPLVDTLNRIVAPNDLFGVMTPNLQPRHIVLGRRLMAVEEQLTRYWTWGERQSGMPDPADPIEATLTACFAYLPNGSEWKVQDNGATRRLDHVLIDRRREDRVLTSFEDTISHLSTLREARTVLMLISDGWLLFGPARDLEQNASVLKTPAGQPLTINSAGRLGVADTLASGAEPGACNQELLRLIEMDSRIRFRTLLMQASRANISVYPVTPGGLGVFDSPISDKDQAFLLGREFSRVTSRIDGLRTLAENTDGLAIVGNNDLSTGMKRIIDDVSAYYLLGYYSTNTRNDGRYRKIELNVKPPGLNTRARRGYFAPTESAAAAGPKGPPPGAATAASDSGAEAAFGTLARLKTTTAVYTSATAAGDELRVVVELASTQLSDDRWSQGADVALTAIGPAGQTIAGPTARIAAGQRSALVRLQLGSPATGGWRIQTRVSAGTAALDDVTQLQLGGGRLLGEAVMFRGTPAASSPLRPVADAQYRRTERVHIEWNVTGPLDRREARLLGRNGQPLPVPVSVTEREVLGRPGIAADLNLAPLSAADYVIELIVGAGSQMERRFIAIRVVQ